MIATAGAASFVAMAVWTAVKSGVPPQRFPGGELRVHEGGAGQWDFGGEGVETQFTTIVSSVQDLVISFEKAITWTKYLSSIEGFVRFFDKRKTLILRFDRAP